MGAVVGLFMEQFHLAECDATDGCLLVVVLYEHAWHRVFDLFTIKLLWCLGDPLGP